MQKIIFTDEQIETLKDLYLNQGLSLEKIGIYFQVSKSTISRICKENNITIRKHNHVYMADYRKFENIDSNEKAYWLGFLAADGCVYERMENASIKININRKDKEHLEKFKIFMNSNVNIKDHEQTTGFSNPNNPSQMSEIVFNSKDMAHDLIDKNITPRKSNTLLPPKIDTKYNLPFILGYFDGDGSLAKTSQYNNYSLNFVGTKELLEWINNQLQIADHLEFKNEDLKNKNNYYIRCGGVDKPYNIMKQLYQSVDVHLDRKYQIYKSLEAVVLNRNIK